MEYPWVSEDFFNQFGLSKLAHHWPTLVLSTLTCQFIIYASRMISPLLFPKAYGSLKNIKRLSWDVHVVSLVHCIVICILAFPLHWDPKLVNDKIYGYSERTGEVYAIASGYFLWDSIFHVLHLKEFGIGFAVHGVACFCLGINSYRPFLMYFGCVFLMFELSTPFLNFHWFMDKLGYTGSLLQMINGVILITVFFCARLVWGFWSMYDLITTVSPYLNQVPLVLTMAFTLALFSLNILNIFWFRKMVQSVGARFEHSEKIKRN